MTHQHLYIDEGLWLGSPFTTSDGPRLFGYSLSEGEIVHELRLDVIITIEPPVDAHTMGAIDFIHVKE